MSDVTITYKGSPIATMDASGTKTLTTQGKYCEANIGVEYVKPSGGGGNANVSQDANSYIVLDDAAPGDGGANILLVSFVAAQDVSTIQISGDFSGYNLYLLELVGSTNTTEWIYPEFNGNTNTVNYLAPRAGATTWNTVLPLIFGTYGVPQFMVENRLWSPARSSGGNDAIGFSTGGDLSSIAFHLYNASHVFTAGFTVKLWGVPLSTTA